MFHSAFPALWSPMQALDVSLILTCVVRPGVAALQHSAPPRLMNSFYILPLFIDLGEREREAEHVPVPRGLVLIMNDELMVKNSSHILEAECEEECLGNVFVFGWGKCIHSKKRSKKAALVVGVASFHTE